MIYGVSTNYKGENNMYLDYAASTPILWEVQKELVSALEKYGNPSSIHTKGIEAKSAINDASKLIADKINCNPDELHYTSGATMANNLAIQGFFRKNPNGHFITSKIEHDDILIMSDWLISQDYDVRYIGNNKDGIVNVNELSETIKSIRSYSGAPILVSIQAANSECGVIQNINIISDICHSFDDVYLHSDFTQYIPYYSVDINYIGVDMMSMSGQKIGCIKGVGLLYVKDGTPISPIIFGEQGLIGGTENTFGIICLAKAFSLLEYGNSDSIIEKRNYMTKHLCGRLVGSNIYRLPNNIFMIFDGVRSESMIALLSEQDIYVSGGSACSSLSDKPSHVVMAMNYSEDEANSCIRFTLPSNITLEEIDDIVDKVNECYELLK